MAVFLEWGTQLNLNCSPLSVLCWLFQSVVSVVCAVVRASAVLPSVSPMFWRDFVYAATMFQSVVSYGTK